METKSLILKVAKQKGVIRTSDIVRLTGIARQTIAQHLKELVEQRKLSKTGSTQKASYRISTSHDKTTKAVIKFTAERKIAGLNEDQVFQECNRILNLNSVLSKNVLAIANYAFTEMLNNAIEHSKSKLVRIQVTVSSGQFAFEIRDRGMGVYENVRRKFNLPDLMIAAEHLLKGKQTTDPKHHSGQGIFFTSKIADLFVLKSQSLELRIDNAALQDTFLLRMPKLLKGTSVFFSIKTQARKNLKTLFDQYTNAEYEFDKTTIIVKLSQQIGGYVSRSEARRILFGLDGFKRIVFDFKKVRGVGQGFSDEIFRVYVQTHPEKKLEIIHAAKEVEFMIQRAMAYSSRLKAEEQIKRGETTDCSEVKRKHNLES